MQSVPRPRSSHTGAPSDEPRLKCPSSDQHGAHSLMHLVRKLWGAIVLAIAGTTLLIWGSVTFVIGAFIGGLAAILGSGLISLVTGSKFLDAYVSNVITWLGILIGGGLAVLRSG